MALCKLNRVSAALLLSLVAWGPTPAAIAQVTPAPAAKVSPRISQRIKVTRFELAGGALKLPGPVLFESGSDRLKPESDEVLAVVLDYLEAKPDITLLRIEGHTDGDGSPAANQTLTERRAMAVARWLIAAGINCSRLMPVGFGSSKPIAANDTPENKAQNRRVAFVNAALRGRMIGGMPADGGGKVAGDPCR